MSSQIRRIASLALLLAATALAGCAQTISFGSPSGLSNGVDSKGWNQPSYVDGPLYDPGQLKYRSTVNFYDLAVSGTTMQIGASLYDTSTAHYLGYARQFWDSGAWGQVGNGFESVGSFGADDAGAVTIGAGPGGIFLETLFDAANPAGAVTSEYVSSSWSSVTSSDTQTFKPDTTVDESQETQAATTVFDALGRAYAFYLDTGSGTVKYGFWQPSAQSNSGGGLLGDTQIDATAARAVITPHWDGARFVCALYETTAGALKSGCIDTTVSPLPAPTLKTIDASGVFGHGSATDGAGNLMVVYYKKVGSAVNVYASYGTGNLSGTGPLADPTWSTPVQIDSSAGINAPDLSATATNSAAAPGVAYLGNGNFVAVWVGQTSGAAAGYNYTELLSSTYLAGQGWTAPTAIANTLDYYYSKPHPRALHVFSNGDNNAGFALNTIYNATCGSPLVGQGYDHCVHDETDYFSSPWCYPALSSYPTCTPPAPTAPPAGVTVYPLQVLWVDRFQADEGWLTTYSPYNQYKMGCQPLDLTNPNKPYNKAPKAGDPSSGPFTGPDISPGFCTARPTGAIFSSGNALVLFQVQDNDGNYRLGGIEFR